VDVQRKEAFRVAFDAHLKLGSHHTKGADWDLRIAVVRSRRGVLGLFRLSPEHLLLKPRHPVFQRLVLSGQLRDLGRLAANDPFKLLSPFFERRFPLDGAGMQGPPVVGLPAKCDLRPSSLGILNEHAGIL